MSQSVTLVLDRRGDASDVVERAFNARLLKTTDADVIAETEAVSLITFPDAESARRFGEAMLADVDAAREGAASAMRMLITDASDAHADPRSAIAKLEPSVLECPSGAVTERLTESPAASQADDIVEGADEPVVNAAPPAAADPSPWFSGAGARRPNPFAKPKRAASRAPAPPAESEAEPRPERAPGRTTALINPTADPLDRCALKTPGRPETLLVHAAARLTVGRSRRDADIVTWVMPRSEKNDALSRTISSTHCRLLLTSSAIAIKHLSSVNPTHVNGIKITSPGALPLDRPSTLTLSANFTLRLTPLPIPKGFDGCLDRWSDALGETGARRWSWSSELGVGGILMERADGLHEHEKYLWLLSLVALDQTGRPVHEDQDGLYLAALPYVSVGVGMTRKGVGLGDLELPAGGVALMTPDAALRLPSGRLDVAACEQDLESQI